MPKAETADTVQKHTEAKLKFYTLYLERYLRVLLQTKYVEKINIYDLYCGAGKYSDGNTGSALRAIEAVKNAQNSNRQGKIVNLHLNDLNTAKIVELQKILPGLLQSETNLRATFSSQEAFAFLGELLRGFQWQNKNTRNLILIDPYGYKDISKESLKAVMDKGRTELVIFLPIEQMYRFKGKTAGEVVENPYLPLKAFIEQFGIDVNSINSEKKFILAVEEAMRFSADVYTTSYSIKNHTGHYYGMFFLTSNLLGLEKINDVKWELDDQKGYEFTGSNQGDFFLERARLDSLYSDLETMISECTPDNIQIYEFVLRRGFRVTHATGALKKLCAEKKIHTIDARTGQAARKGTFKLNYVEFKTGKPSILFRIGMGDCTA
ncbi:MAG: three-Cys-motif partner protein TcmP [Pseudomonadaceae bacterium]